jgi:amino acid adenylation domain-containing protein
MTSTAGPGEAALHAPAPSPQQQLILACLERGVHDASCVIDIDGDLDVARLRAAIFQTASAHDALRPQWAPAPGQPADGQPGPGQPGQATWPASFQVIDRDGHASAAGHATSAAAAAWSQAPAPGPALILAAGQYAVASPGTTARLRAILVRAAQGKHFLILTAPALMADTASMGNLAGEIARRYDGHVPAAPMPYGDFAAWQNALLEDDEGERRRWIARLTDHARAHALPFEAHADAARPPAYRAATLAVSPAATATLMAAAQARATTLDSFLLACWVTLLWQQTRAGHVAVGLVSDGRPYEELASVVGPCGKALPMLVQVAGTETFPDLLRRVEQATEAARDGQEYFNWAGDSGAHPAWGFEVEAPPPRAVTAGGARFTPGRPASWRGPFTVKLAVQPDPGALRLLLQHDARTDDAMAACLLDQVLTLALDAASHPQATVSTLTALSPAQARLLDNNQAGHAPPGRCAHQLFEDQATLAPGRIAVRADGAELTYADLDARSTRLARHLRELGAGPEVAVGISLDRGAAMVVAVLAVHKAGAAYVPIDPAYPADRIRAIIADTDMAILITQEEVASRLPAGPWPSVLLDRDAAPPASATPGTAADLAPGSTSLNRDIHPGQLAYILHTSGSTGRPKGVQVSHGALANFLCSMRREPGITPDDNLVAVTTLSFDISGLELYLPLIAGGCVTVATREQAADPRALARLISATGATVMQATPVTWRMLLASGWAGQPGLTALIGGEAWPPGLAARLLPRIGRLWNMYGPTETTIWSTCAQVTGDEAISVGLPIAGTTVRVLDESLHPVAVGMVGELCIGGAGVARGYAKRAGLTAGRFIPDPGATSTAQAAGMITTAGARLYRTGDLARYDPTGKLYILGRTDSQVKIRGFRIELGEVESVLASHPQVQAAVAAARPEDSGEMRLDAYVVPAEGSNLTVGDLRRFVLSRLPPMMAPSRIGLLDALPLTANGKVDRARLPDMAADHDPGHPDPPTTTILSAAADGLARVVAGAWEAALGISPLPVTENFFDLGGHSVLLTQVSGDLTEKLGYEVSPLTILAHPTIAALAAHLRGDDDGQGEESPALPASGARSRLLRRRSRAADG